MGGGGLLVRAAWLALLARPATAQYVLTPAYFNIAENRPITANATCGEGAGAAGERYCKLVAGYDRIDETWMQGKKIVGGQVRLVIQYCGDSC